MIELKMIKLSLDSYHVDKITAEVLRVLKNGGIVAYPTESFYALGVMAGDKNAVNKLFLLKKRPSEKAMPVIVGSLDILKTIVKHIPPGSEALMTKYWPGPLTIIFDSKNNLPEILTDDRGKIAVRIPGESFALDLAKAADFPVTATSANISGKPPAQEAEQIMKYFNEKIDMIVDGGKNPGGKLSTIIDAVSLKVLREGRVSLDTTL